MGPQINPAFRQPPQLPGGPPTCVQPRQPPLHRAKTHIPGPTRHYYRPHVSLSATTAAATSVPNYCAAYLLTTLTVFTTMAPPRHVAELCPPRADLPSVKSTAWSTLTVPSQLTQASLDLSPLDRILPMRPILSPGVNFRRNCLSRRRFRKLRRISRLSLTKSYLEYRQRVLSHWTCTPPPPPPVRILPLLPPEKTVLSKRIIWTMAN